MLSKSTFAFLHDLESHNNRDWFQANKARYDAAKQDFAGFIAVLLNHLTQFDEELSGTQAEECLFRIFRDVRFSKNKAPYKTNFGAYMAPGGRKSMKPGYYLHLDPKQCFLAGGAYCPEPPQLLKIRQRIANHPDEFFGSLSAPAFKKTFGDLSASENKLVKVPKGFPTEHVAAEYLKYKSYIAFREIKPSEFGEVEKLAAQFQLIKPLNDFLRRAIS